MAENELSDEAQAMVGFLREANRGVVANVTGATICDDDTTLGPMAQWLLGAGVRLPNAWIPDRQTRELQEASDATKPADLPLGNLDPG
jgi:hypothetical protein